MNRNGTVIGHIGLLMVALLLSINCDYKEKFDTVNKDVNASIYLKTSNMLTLANEPLFVGEESLRMDAAEVAVEQAITTRSKEDIELAKEKILLLQSVGFKELLTKKINDLEYNIYQSDLIVKANELFVNANNTKNETDILLVEEVILNIDDTKVKEEYNLKVTNLKNEIEEEKKRKALAEAERIRKEEEARKARAAQYVNNSNNNNSYVTVSPPDDSQVIERIIGSVSAYSPYCEGCGGRVATGMDVRNGNIYYYDPVYGKVRIIAGDPSYPFGTIVRFNNIKGGTTYAIVLDRGGAIGKGRRRLWDLLFNTTNDAYAFGVAYDVEADILRLGY